MWDEATYGRSLTYSASAKFGGVPEGLWIRCPHCKATVYKKEVESRQHVCPECDHHFTMPARDRIAQLLDEDREPVTTQGAPTFGVSWTGPTGISGVVLREGEAPGGPRRSSSSSPLTRSVPAELLDRQALELVRSLQADRVERHRDVEGAQQTVVAATAVDHAQHRADRAVELTENEADPVPLLATRFAITAVILVAYQLIQVRGDGTADHTQTVRTSLAPGQTYYVDVHASRSDMERIVGCADLHAAAP